MEANVEGSSLSPWHIKVQVTPEIATDAFETINLIDTEVSFKELLNEIYPEQDFQNKIFLDCACNCGAYCFWARSVGFSQCYGFDVREHWIKQANWLKENITTGPTDGIQFKKMDLYELNRVGLPQFNLTFFKGLFYHLPYPVKGLQLAADLTKDVLIINTRTKPDLPKNCFVVEEEPSEESDLLSGVHGLCFTPSGPEAIIKILKWMGFVRFKIMYSKLIRPGYGRTQIIAYRHHEKIAIKNSKKVKI
jgi:hypothetical protein